ncbi:MAG: hypothetical protein IEMM0008_1562 [bacterium]|nr:MAG: hypothetical protein IEMM0008_1562 [bacterium]
MSKYVGVDLHSNNNYIGIIDQKGRTVFQKKNPNDLDTILKSLDPYKELIKGIVIESTFNWYWLVDGLMGSGYKVHLANTTAIQQYSGLKYTDDKSDALWLAEMLRLKILPEGYIYPKGTRGLRDLLRRRMQLVQHRTALYLSMKGMIHNWTGLRINRSDMKHLDSGDMENIFSGVHERLSAQSLLEVIRVFNKEIIKIEKAVIPNVSLREEFKQLLTVCGIGEILGITIMLETGDIRRFSEVGNYSSYCRCVSSKKLTNNKKKGSGNKKNGNKYLAWAYVEAAHYMQRYSPKAKSWYQRKASKRGQIVATKALSNKIARACYYIMKDRTAYNPEKMFG